MAVIDLLDFLSWFSISKGEENMSHLANNMVGKGRDDIIQLKH